MQRVSGCRIDSSPAGRTYKLNLIIIYVHDTRVVAQATTIEQIPADTIRSRESFFSESKQLLTTMAQARLADLPDSNGPEY